MFEGILLTCLLGLVTCPRLLSDPNESSPIRNFNNLLSPRQSVAPAHQKIMADRDLMRCSVRPRFNGLDASPD